VQLGQRGDRIEGCYMDLVVVVIVVIVVGDIGIKL